LGLSLDAAGKKRTGMFERSAYVGHRGLGKAKEFNMKRNKMIGVKKILC